MSGDNKEASPVKAAYSGANVFITGATGFLGVALLEKLLRSFPDLGTVYLLVREKRGKDVDTRVQEITKNSVFETLIAERGADVFSKLVGVEGDVSEEGLGIKPAMRQKITATVNYVFHSAATLDFEATLKPTVNINLLGTRRVVQLSTECTNLKAMVHVSSAYVNSDKRKVEEILYPAPGDAEEVIKMTTSLSDAQLETSTPGLLKDHPNTYTFTKALAEHEVANSISKFPSAIVRPSMITASWKEPVPGWTVSKNGPTGFLMGASKGVVRRLPVNADLVYDYVPVDVVVNSLILAGFKAATLRPPATLIYHATSSTINPFRWSSVELKINKYLHKYPLKGAVWYPALKLLPSLMLFRISAIFVHFAPAYVLDTITRIAGGRPILVRLHTNISNSLVRLEPFIFNEWFFDNFRTMELSKSLTPKDSESFFIDIQTLNWENYFLDMVQGVRRYLSNEKESSLPAARRKDKILLVAHLATQALIMGLIWYLFSIIIGTTLTKSGWIVPLTYMLFTFL